MHLRTSDIAELAAVLPLAIDREPYRERLTPLACAVLEGNSRRTIESRRDLVLPDVWDARLHQATLDAIGRLRDEIVRKMGLLEAAVDDLERAPRKSAMARAVVDRVLADLLDDNDKNIEALIELEQQLAGLGRDEGIAHAALAARGAYVAARIPTTEVRAAIVRTARVVRSRGFDEEMAFDRGARMLARTLATNDRREAAREWVRRLAEGSADHVPRLSAALQDLAVESAASPPDDDLVWIQACVGLTLDLGLAES